MPNSEPPGSRADLERLVSGMIEAERERFVAMLIESERQGAAEFFGSSGSPGAEAPIGRHPVPNPAPGTPGPCCSLASYDRERLRETIARLPRGQRGQEDVAGALAVSRSTLGIHVRKHLRLNWRGVVAGIP